MAFDGSSPGMLPPFAIESEETRAMARHCTVGIETRISSERIILLDTQPVLSPSVLGEIIRPDGSSTISVLSGESLSAELAHELMGIQFLTDNTDFTVIGVIGSPGAGKSTIMNEIYGFDGSSPGMLPPFAIVSEETRAMARHCTVGIEPRISSERIILLDTQVFLYNFLLYNHYITKKILIDSPVLVPKFSPLLELLTKSLKVMSKKPSLTSNA